MTRVNLATQAGLDAATFVPTTVQLNWSNGPNGNRRITGTAVLSGSGSHPLYMAGMIGLVPAAPASTVINNMTISVAPIPLSSNVLDVGVLITVSDLTMTNVLTLTFDGHDTAQDTSFGTSLDESTSTPDIGGADLSIAGGVVTSTAGGVFVVTYSLFVGWD